MTFIPPGGVIEARGQTQLVYGAAINRYKPIGDNKAEEGRERNRRTDFQIIPNN